ELVDVITCPPFPEYFAVPGDFDQPVVLEPFVRYLVVGDVGMRQNERVTARDGRLDAWRVVASREARPLPVVVLPCGRHWLAVGVLDPLPPIEAPALLPVPTHRPGRPRLRVGAPAAAPRYYDPAGQDASGPARRARETGPLLHRMAVHVDHDHALRFG